MNFKVGEIVLCVKDHSQGLVVKGRGYPVLKTKDGCCAKSPQKIDVGAELPIFYAGTKCRHCGNTITSRTFWLNSTLFVRKSSQEYAETLLEEIEIEIEEEIKE